MMLCICLVGCLMAMIGALSLMSASSRPCLAISLWLIGGQIQYVAFPFLWSSYESFITVLLLFVIVFLIVGYIKESRTK